MKISGKKATNDDNLVRMLVNATRKRMLERDQWLPTLLRVVSMQVSWRVGQ